MNQAIQRFQTGGAVALKHERELLQRVTIVGLGKTAGIFLFRFFIFPIHSLYTMPPKKASQSGKNLLWDACDM
jgi:hypothetical protein